ncbi:hypothetical protein K1719_004585 [Acacia pycnantha]|nr:hypothetical protein K1719_004585 [Acacia pycnantha]
MASVVYWNVRGACGKDLIQNIKVVCKEPRPCLLILSETKCEKAAQLSKLKNLGYNGVAFIPSVGRSGGMAAFWKETEISISIIMTNRQYLHMRCSLNGGPPFYLTALYAIPIQRFKEELWYDLQKLANSPMTPWAVIGDYNDILSADERTGGASVNFSRINLFRERVQGCQLTDLGFSGPKFTWRGKEWLIVQGCTRD